MHSVPSTTATSPTKAPKENAQFVKYKMQVEYLPDTGDFIVRDVNLPFVHPNVKESTWNFIDFLKNYKEVLSK